MRWLQTALLCAVAALLVIDGTAATKAGNFGAKTLRSLAAEGVKNQEVEERGITSVFTKLKKLVPGTKAHKQAAAAAAAAKKAEQDKFIAMVTKNDDNLFDFFRKLKGKSRLDVREIFKSFGKSEAEATNYANRFFSYTQTANAGARNKRVA